MKIGFVLDDSLDKPDGVQQYVLTVSKWFHQQGHEIHYLVGETRREDLDNLHSLSKNINVRFNANRLSVPLPAPKQKLKDLLETQQFDVLHIQMPHNPFLAGRIVKASPKKTAIIGTFHVAPFSKFETAATRLLGLWLRPNVRRFDEVVSVSKTAQKFALRTFRIDTPIVPNPVDISEFKPAHISSPSGPIVFLGRLVPRKGCLELLKAYALLSKKQVNLPPLKICGDGPQRHMLESYAKQHDLTKVEFVGFVSEEQKKDYLSQASIAVFPSTGGESFGIVLLEAMASGAGVVIGGNNSGYQNVLESMPEVLCNPIDTKSLALLLEKYINDPDLAKLAHSKQQQLVKQYDISVVGKQLMQVYEQAIAKRIKNKHNKS